jgi:hypothetical protein
MSLVENLSSSIGRSAHQGLDEGSSIWEEGGDSDPGRLRSTVATDVVVADEKCCNRVEYVRG